MSQEIHSIIIFDCRLSDQQQPKAGNYCEEYLVFQLRCKARVKLNSSKYFISILLQGRMQLVIDLQASQLLSLEELQKTICISSIIFSLVIDGNLQLKMAKIISYVPFLSKFPSLRTSFKIQSVETIPITRYSTVALGGTFDYLHLGHQLLLLYGALAAEETIYVGVTGDTLLAKKKYKQALQHLTIRMQEVQDFIKMINPDLKSIVFELNDPFGPTIDHADIQCLVASPETASSLIKINQIRGQKSLKGLQLVVCPLLSHSQQISSKISSSGIREYYLKKNGFKQEQLLEYRQYFFKLIADMKEYTGMKQNKEKIAEKWWDSLFRRYSQYWRFYHTNQHIYQLLKDWNSQTYAKSQQAITKQQRIIVEIALFFHDIVYVPSSPNNEKASAGVAASFIQEYLGTSQGAEGIKQSVIQLIVQTENHVPSSKLSQIVYNLDMGILNADKGRYKEYANKIKKEYEPLVKQKYNQKRKSFLLKTLEEKQYFSFETQNVKSNLEWEIFCLENDDL